MLIIRFPLCISENTCLNTKPLRFKYQIEFTSLFLSQGLTYCHYMPEKAAQITGKCKDCLRQLLTVEEIKDSMLKELLIESDYTSPTEVIELPLCSFPYNPSIRIYDQVMAHQFLLITVPYYFIILPEGSPTPQQLTRQSKTWVGNLQKSC